MPPRRQGKSVLITGCSSGIGQALAKRLYTAEEYRVIVTARGKSIDRLREEFTESDRFLIRELDVREPVQIRHVIEEMSDRFRRVDNVINNAGICYRGVVEHMDENAELDQIKTNYLGPLEIIRRVLPLMREQRSGCIINISSASAIMPVPTMASYAASKHALEAATEALWYEARPFGIRVVLAQPGFVNSNSHYNVRLARKAEISEFLYGPHSEFYKSLSPFVSKMMRLAIAKPDKIAERILHIMERKHPRLRIPVTIDASIFSLMRKLLPAGIFHRLIYAALPGSKTWGAGPRLTRKERELT